MPEAETLKIHKKDCKARNNYYSKLVISNYILLSFSRDIDFIIVLHFNSHFMLYFLMLEYINIMKRLKIIVYEQ